MPPARELRVFDPDYPAALRQLPSPPDPLFVEGEIPAGPSVAIIGTRSPSIEAAGYARALAGRLAEAGVTVWSGGAVGIDAAAHQGALESRGRTVVVVGTGLDHTYPEEHRGLYERAVAEGGAIVSPFARDTRGAQWTFLQRNPVLAALTDATILVQAPLKSGARSTAAAARKLGRTLHVVPAAPWDTRGAGNLAEIALGGRPLVDAETLLATLGVRRPPAPRRPPRGDDPTLFVPVVHAAAARARPSTPPAAPLALDPDPTRVVALVGAVSPACEAVVRAAGSRALHPDDFCRMTGLSAGVVQQALVTLTLQAVLVEGPGGCFRKVSG